MPVLARLFQLHTKQLFTMFTTSKYTFMKHYLNALPVLFVILLQACNNETEKSTVKTNTDTTAKKQAETPAPAPAAVKPAIINIIDRS
jgi:hypothetical protein